MSSGSRRSLATLVFGGAVLALGHAAAAAGFHITRIGTWVKNGDEILYVYLQEPITSTCPHKEYYKVVLNGGTAGVQAGNANFVRSLVTAALLSKKSVTFQPLRDADDADHDGDKTEEVCVCDYASFSVIYLSGD